MTTVHLPSPWSPEEHLLASQYEVLFLELGEGAYEALLYENREWTRAMVLGPVSLRNGKPIKNRTYWVRGEEE